MCYNEDDHACETRAHCVDLVFSQTGAAPTLATLVHDVADQPLLALLSRHAQRVLLLMLPSAPLGMAPIAVDTVLDTEALAVAAVSATRTHINAIHATRDLLVLRPNGILSLFWGAHCMVNVTVNAAALASAQATPCTSSAPRPAAWYTHKPMPLPPLCTHMMLLYTDLHCSHIVLHVPFACMRNTGRH